MHKCALNTYSVVEREQCRLGRGESEKSGLLRVAFPPLPASVGLPSRCCALTLLMIDTGLSLTAVGAWAEARQRL